MPGRAATPTMQELLLTVGRLSEAAESGATALRDSGEQVREVATQTAVLEQGLRHVNQTVEELNKLVRIGNGRPALLFLIQQISEDIRRLRTDLGAVETTQAALKEELGKLSTAKAGAHLLWRFVVAVALFLGWVATTVISYYAAQGQKTP